MNKSHSEAAAYTTVVYLVCVDQGTIICSSNEDRYSLPVAKLCKDYPNQEAIKNDIASEMQLHLGRYSFRCLGPTQDKGIVAYSLVIDLSSHKNGKILGHPAFQNAQALPFLAAFYVKWDPGSETAIYYLGENPNFQDAIQLIRHDQIHYFSKRSGMIVQEHLDAVTNIWQSDRPDVIVEAEKRITGIECFQIDASCNDSKGSVGTKAKKAMTAKALDGRIGEPTVVTQHIPNSLSNLWDAFLRQYKGHQKLQDYLNNLCKMNPEVEHSLGFFIQDVTLLGSHYRPKGQGTSLLFLFNIEEFWTLFLANKRLAFVLLQQTGIDGEQLFCITKYDYYYLKRQGRIHPIAEIDAWFFNDPNIIGTRLYIPFAKKGNR